MIRPPKLRRMIRYRVFSFTWPASMQISWNKRKHLHKKRVQLSEDWFGTPTWPPFHCFGTPIWPTWRHVKALYTQYFQHLSLTWLTQWSNLTSLCYGQFSLSLGKAPTFPLHSYTLKWGPVRAGAQLVRVNSDKRYGLGTAILNRNGDKRHKDDGLKLWQRYGFLLNT